jgi:ribosomal protein L13E
MSNTIQVSAARIPDRDRLLRELEETGLTAKAVDELGIVVDCAAGDDASNEIFAHVERVIMSIGASFVPTKHEDVIYIRPPVG